MDTDSSMVLYCVRDFKNNYHALHLLLYESMGLPATADYQRIECVDPWKSSSRKFNLPFRSFIHSPCFQLITQNPRELHTTATMCHYCRHHLFCCYMRQNSRNLLRVISFVSKSHMQIIHGKFQFPLNVVEQQLKQQNLSNHLYTYTYMAYQCIRRI